MPFYEIKKNKIKNLNETSLPKLVKYIMHYEVAKLNITHKSVDISLNTKAPDGGSDGEFHISNKSILKKHNFLPASDIIFQFKAESVRGKEYFKKELIDKTTKDLKPRLKEFIEKNYLYMLISNKTNTSHAQLERKERILLNVFEEIGYKNVKVKIIDITKLQEWASSIPQIYFKFNKHSIPFKQFKQFKEIISKEGEDTIYINDEERMQNIKQIHKEINKVIKSKTLSFIRVEGFSGIGKTRLIYESLKKYGKFVLYAIEYSESIFNGLLKYSSQIPSKNDEFIIFVIDECDYRNHVKICRELQNYNNIIVITINHIHSLKDTKCKGEVRINLKGLDEEERKELILNIRPILSEDTAKKIAYYSDGYPRLAKFMAESYDIDKGDTNDFDEKARLLDEILNKITKEEQEDMKLLQIISIFKLFPDNDSMEEYKLKIFKFYKIDDYDASMRISNLIDKGIIRKAGRFLYISPRPISIHLLNKFLEHNNFNTIDKLFKSLENQSLMNSFFEKLQGIEFNSSQHKDLLHRIFSKLTYEELNSGLGSKIFYTLCLKDRQYSLNILDKILQNKSKEDLLKLEDGRRYLDHALEELISFRDTFVGSAKILFQLARAENESWGNNSKGIFIESFQLVLGGTEVNIVNRLDLLKSLYQEYTNDNDRIILLEALNNSYPKHKYMATHKNNSSVPENIPDHYYPETKEEIDAYFEKLKELIVIFNDDSSKKLQTKILSDLVHSLRMMIQNNQINIWILDFIENSLSEHIELKTLIFEKISMIYKYDKDEKLSKNVLTRLEKIYNLFVDTDKIEETKELFFKTDRYRYNSEDTFNNHCKAISKDIFTNRDFKVLLDKKTSNVYEIGIELALIDIDNILYKDILNLISNLDENSNDRFILSYLFNTSKTDIDNYESLFNDIYTRLNDKNLMFNFIHYFKPTDISIKYLYKLLKNKDIDSSLLENLTFGFWLRDFEKNEFLKFIDNINSLIKNKCDSFELCMQYIHRNKDKKLVEKFTLYYLENDIFTSDRKHRDTYYIDTMIDDYFTNNLELTENILLKIWEAILIEFDNDGKFEDGRFPTIYKIILNYPDFFWEKTKNRLDELKPINYPLYGRFVYFMQGGYMSCYFNNSIFNYIDCNKVIKWLRITKYEKARYIVADSFNIDFKSDSLPNIVLKILTEFPNDRDLYSSIQCNSESWSGSYIHVVNLKIKNIDTMIELYKGNDSVLDFLKWAKKSFENGRDREQIRDEERYLSR